MSRENRHRIVCRNRARERDHDAGAGPVHDPPACVVFPYHGRECNDRHIRNPRGAFGRWMSVNGQPRSRRMAPGHA